MRILHISDTHGLPPTPPDPDNFDVVVHSGDLMPNRTFGLKVVEETFQAYWIENTAHEFHEHYRAKPFLFVPGNHDYIDPVPALRAHGIDARSLCETSVELEGVTFYGHPWSPEFGGWNWMCGEREMGERLAPFARRGANVLVSHGPMYGVLDRNRSGHRCGCKVLRSVLQDMAEPPKALLHGHIHEAAGLMRWSRGIDVSNAARTQRIVTV